MIHTTARYDLLVSHFSTTTHHIMHSDAIDDPTLSTLKPTNHLLTGSSRIILHTDR